MVSAGLEEGLLLARQDVLRGVRWYRPVGPEIVAEDTGKYVHEADIPTAACLHALARTAASHTGVWWRGLQILLVAYSGLRWGEHAALTADRAHTAGRRVLVIVRSSRRSTA
jgi:hypothetical protein